MKNAGLDESQVGIKIAWRKINNLRYTDDTTFKAESEKLKSFLMKVKEESEKSGLKLNNHCGITPYHFMANKGGKVETVTDFLFLGSKITADG